MDPFCCTYTERSVTAARTEDIPLCGAVSQVIVLSLEIP